MPGPSAAISRTACGPAAVNSWLPILNRPTRSATCFANFSPEDNESKSDTTDVADPGSVGLRRITQIRHQRRFHRRSDDEHQGNPTECSPNNEESVSHSVFFVLQLPRKCSGMWSLCQPFSTMNLPS